MLSLLLTVLNLLLVLHVLHVAGHEFQEDLLHNPLSTEARLGVRLDFAFFLSPGISLDRCDHSKVTETPSAFTRHQPVPSAPEMHHICSTWSLNQSYLFCRLCFTCHRLYQGSYSLMRALGEKTS